MGSKSSPKVKVPPPSAPAPQRTEASTGGRNQYDLFLKMRKRAGREGTILTGLGGQAQTLGLMGY